jgi:putrescine importer
VLGGTSLAVLTYIGFDGISTLSEEAENPRRNILLATVLTCVAIGILSTIEVYTAQLVWPATQPYPDVDTAFVYIAQRVGGGPLFFLITLTLLIATVGSGMAAQLGAARLLYGMGRSGALPRSFFGVIRQSTQIPSNNVWFVGCAALFGAFLLSYERGAELLNFGALIAFMGVNLAALLRYYFRAAEKKLLNLLLPTCGFLVCLLLWLNLSHPATIVGLIWMSLGVAFGAWKTRGFRKELVNFDLPLENE